MIQDLLFQFEQKVDNAIELIELLRLQIEELEEENTALRGEQEKWRDDLVNLINRFDQIDPSATPVPVAQPEMLLESESQE